MRSLPVAPKHRASRTGRGSSKAHLREHCSALHGKVLYCTVHRLAGKLPSRRSEQGKTPKALSDGVCMVSAMASAI
jgi:hypothetical protein